MAKKKTVVNYNTDNVDFPTTTRKTRTSGVIRFNPESITQKPAHKSKIVSAFPKGEATTKIPDGKCRVLVYWDSADNMAKGCFSVLIDLNSLINEDIITSYLPKIGYSKISEIKSGVFGFKATEVQYEYKIIIE